MEKSVDTTTYEFTVRNGLQDEAIVAITLRDGLLPQSTGRMLAISKATRVIPAEKPYRVEWRIIARTLAPRISININA